MRYYMFICVVMPFSRYYDFEPFLFVISGTNRLSYLTVDMCVNRTQRLVFLHKFVFKDIINSSIISLNEALLILCETCRFGITSYGRKNGNTELLLNVFQYFKMLRA